MKARLSTMLLVLAAATLSHHSAADESQSKLKPGELIVDHPTLINFGFEWLIGGDDSRNPRVDVSYAREANLLRSTA